MEKKKKVVWFGSTRCDFCGKDCGDTLIDGVTNTGPWATMCKSCYDKHGIGRLGPGLGQMYKKNADGKLEKVEG